MSSSESEDDPAMAEQKDDSSPIEDMPLWREVLFVGVISSAQFCTQAGLGQCLALLNVISDHFGITNDGEVGWLIASFSLTVGTFILVAGRLGDLFGYKRMLIIGYSWYAVWSLVAGLSYYSNHFLFDFARIFQGMGPAIMLPNGLAILGATYKPGNRKNVVFSIFGATAPAGSTLGAVFAGIFHLAFWPWTFWAMSMALFGLAVGAYFFVPDPPAKGKRSRTWKELMRDTDALGGLFGVLGLLLVNFSWNQAGVSYWTSTPYLWVTLILGVLCVTIFIYVEIKVSESPLIPFDALTADVALVLGCVASGWSCFGIWVYYVWLFLLDIRSLSPLQAAAWTVPLIFSGGTAALVTGQLLSRIRPGWVMLAALTAFLVGTVVIATVPDEQIYWAQAFVCFIIIPWGMDMSFPAATVIMSNAVSKEHQGIAASLVNTVVNYSISLSLGFAATVLYYTETDDDLTNYRHAWWFGIGLAGLGIGCASALLIKSYREDAKDRRRGEREEREKA